MTTFRNNKQAQRRAAADRSRHTRLKIRGNAIPGAVFSHLMFEMIFYHFHSLFGKKYTKMIGHMSWLYQQAQRQATVGRSRHKRYGIFQYQG